MKRVLPVLVLALAVSGCSTSQQTDQDTAAPPAGPASAVTAARPQLPPLEPRLTVSGDRVPWGRVGSGWQLVMTVRGVDADGEPQATDARLRLVSPTGRSTDVVVMDEGVAAGSLVRHRQSPFPTVEDLAADDRAALLLFHATSRDATAVLLDLVSGEQRRARVPMGTAGLALRDEGFAYLDARGRLVAADWDGTTRVVSRTTGVVLPHADRSGVVAAHPLRVLGFDGSVRRLPEPTADSTCNPRGWWDTDTILVTCGRSSWATPLDGGPSRLVARASGEVGIDDAVPVGDDTYVQVLEGCGGAWLARAEPGGSTTDLDGTRGRRLLGVVGDRLLVQPATPCGTPGRHVGLALLDPTDGARETLVRVRRDEVVTSVRPWAGLPQRLG
jgi:hypothetical protein